MRFARFSIAGLAGVVGLCAFGLASLLHAATPWAGAVFSINLGLLTVALIGVIYRMGARRAFWVGFSICGWVYLVLSHGPWFKDVIGPRLATSQMLDWAYPWLIPYERQDSGYRPPIRSFQIQGPILGEGLASFNLSNSRVDVWVKKEGEKAPTFLLGDLAVGGYSGSSETVTRASLQADSNQWARLSQARAAGVTFLLERHHTSPFAPLWFSPLVSSSRFHQVGQSWFGLLFGWIGGWVARYFHATRDRGP
jgi:hypothetical protein